MSKTKLEVSALICKIYTHAYMYVCAEPKFKPIKQIFFLIFTFDKYLHERVGKD